jgi:acyl-coenzyme A thioesterase PaaI-like protein
MATYAMRFLPDIVESEKNAIREMWDRMHGVPGGKALFSRLVGMAAPYTGTIHARVEELRRGYSRVTMQDRRGLRNHLRCVHAVALANLAELTGNIALAYTIPDDARFIVAGMSLDYVKKARGTITGICECAHIDSSDELEYDVHVRLVDESGDVVVRATLRSLVGPKKRAAR